jgi:phage/plasmid-associated DNA primase
VTLATEEYKASQDTFATFLAECTIEVEQRTRTKVGSLWEAWRAWCERGGERSGRKQDFASALEEHGFEVESYQNAKSVRGLGLRESGEVS